jgi:multiple sugar transport system substrate-binding protein
MAALSAVGLTATLTMGSSTSLTYAASSPNPVTITWYLTVNATQNAWERHVIPIFEKSHPNIRVELETTPYSEFDSKLSALFASGNPPDIWTDFGSSGVGEYYARGMLMNLSPLMKQYHFDSAGIPAKLLGYSHFKGGQYGIPFDSLGQYIFYNKAMFEKNHLALPPYSWNDKSWTLAKMIQDAKAITRNGTNPTKATWGILDSMDEYGLSPMLLYGTNPFNRKKGFATHANFTSPAGYATFNTWTNMMNKWHIMPSYSYQQTYGSGNAPALFTVGRVGMLWSGGWELSSLIGSKIPWGIAPVPYVNTDTAPTYTDPWFIAKGAKNPGAAFQFIEFLTGPVAMDSYMKYTGYSPANTKYVPYWTNLFKQNVAPKDMATVFNGSIAHGLETFSNELAGYAQVYTQLGNEVTPMMNGVQSVKKALPYLESTVNQTLHQILVTHGS